MARRRGARPALRLIAMLGIIALLFTGVGVRLVQLQVVQAAPLESLGVEQRVREIELPAARGMIVDRDLDPLAISTEARAIYANPQLLAEDDIDLRLMASQLAPALDRSASWIRAQLAASDRGFVYLARRQRPEVARAVMALRLPYVGTLQESMRTYPADDTAGQVLGFVDVDSNGISGLEAQYDPLLRGEPGYQRLERDPQGRPIPQGHRSIVDPSPGDDLVLTIDRDIQYVAEQALRRGVKRTRATRGTAVVLDTRTGEVVAMANWPSLDPNSFGGAESGQIRNRVVTDAYEPGSVFKVLAAAAAIEDGVATPDTTMTVPYSIRVADSTFTDYAYHATERMTYAEALAESSNVGTIKIAQRVGSDRLYRVMKRFGIGRKSGVGFPGESSGLLLDEDAWSGTSIATIPIGQGVAVTPLQMASVYATIANDGVRIPPRLVRGTVDALGEFTPIEPPTARRVVSGYTAAQVRGMLLGVVEEGTGRTAQIPGYLVGGKTGTARVPRPDALGYSNRIITTFAGIAPVDDPRLVALVQLEDPKPRLASLTAAPVFQEIMRAALAMMRIPPTIERAADGSLVERAAPAPRRVREATARARRAAEDVVRSDAEGAERP